MFFISWLLASSDLFAGAQRAPLPCQKRYDYARANAPVLAVVPPRFNPSMRRWPPPPPPHDRPLPPAVPAALLCPTAMGVQWKPPRCFQLDEILLGFPPLGSMPVLLVTAFACSGVPLRFVTPEPVARPRLKLRSLVAGGLSILTGVFVLSFTALSARGFSASASSVLKTKVKDSHDTKLPNIQHGDAPGLDKRTAQRLRRGRINVEAQLDLHVELLGVSWIALLI